MVQSLLKLLWEKLDGWKAVIGYITASLPAGVDHAPLVEAVQQAIANPNFYSITSAVGHILLVLALVHRSAKNVGLVSSENDSAAKQLSMPPRF